MVDTTQEGASLAPTVRLGELAGDLPALLSQSPSPQSAALPHVRHM